MASPLFSSKVAKDSQMTMDSAKRIIDQASERAGDLYENASAWLDENRGKTLIFAALFVSAGLLGFFLGKNVSDKNVERY